MSLTAGIRAALSRNLAAVVIGVVILVAWEGGTRGFGVPHNLIPPPSMVIWSLFVRYDLLISHGWLTFYQTIIGFGLSVVIGIVIGWTISKSRLLYDAFYPVIVVLQVVPKEALAPLLILWFGAGMLSRMLLAFLISFFPMVINTILGIASLEPNMRRYATSLSCNWWQLFIKVEFPWSLGSIFADMKISVTLAVIGVVVAEIVAGRSGLGYLLLFASSRLDMAFSLAIILVLAMWGGAMFGAVVLLEKKAIHWRI